MNLIVLAYHSHRVLGADYSTNDHIALAQDIATIGASGYRITTLESMVSAFQRMGDDINRETPAKARMVALTFDDGPVYDLCDFIHPAFGLQRGFVNIMRDFVSSSGAASQPTLHATSFVIASPAGRRLMESAAEPQYSYLTPDSLNDSWWPKGIESGLLSIANHSWDHLHPSLPFVAHSEQVKGDFSKVTSFADADAQVASAGNYIDAVTNSRTAPFFAYPFGHFNNFLVQEYFPQRARALRLRAAFTTEPRFIERSDSIWALPRFVSGCHWTTPEGLADILRRSSS
jgi:peptidoglycan/xylan/chitin deacetylase (PgdA/CDA1 family)